MNNPFTNLKNFDDLREVKSKKKKFMILLLGDKKFALPLSLVREVIAPPPLTLLPHMPSYFTGVVNLRGKIISVIHLKKSLSQEDSNPKMMKGKRPCIIITDLQGHLFGALVDDVTEVISVTENQIDLSLNEELQGERTYQGVLKFSDFSVAPILNVEVALKIEELKKIQSTHIAS